ncbi:MAG: hypothetical protein KIS62_19750 [Ramlibacter sp.]|nr:hypothetical protein [Ramlibacter sp.]
MPNFRAYALAALERLSPSWGGLAIGVVMGLGVAAHIAATMNLREAAALRALTEAAHGKIEAESKRIPVDASNEFASRLASRTQVDDVVRDAGRLAKSANMVIHGITLTRSAATGSTWGHVLVSINATCEYKACKALIAELQGRYASLAIQSLALRPASAGPGQQDMQLGLRLYVKD